MKPGDLIHIYFSGKGSNDEEITGILLKLRDFSAKKKSDRRIHISLLCDGRVHNTVLYWDDEVEVLA